MAVFLADLAARMVGYTGSRRDARGAMLARLLGAPLLLKSLVFVAIYRLLLSDEKKNKAYNLQVNM